MQILDKFDRVTEFQTHCPKQVNFCSRTFRYSILD